MTLSLINSGATFAMNPAPRGTCTFGQVADHAEGKPTVELTVDYAAPDIVDFTLSVSCWHVAEMLEEAGHRK